MKNGSVGFVEMDDQSPSSGPRVAVPGPRRAKLASITPEGVVLVTLGAERPVLAEIATEVSDRTLLRAIEHGATVLIDFLDGDPERPVILGLLRDRLDVDRQDVSSVTEPRIELTAGETLSLRCGESAIELQKSGHIVIRGGEIRSTASGGNVIQGAHVEIN